MTAADKIQIREYFKVLQNQDKLRAGEIINAVEDNILCQYFNVVGYDFLKTIKYEGLKRAEFEKTYYATIGTILGDIPQNIGDKSVIKYVENLNSLDIEEIKVITTINDNLCYIKELLDVGNVSRMTKRTLKLIIGVSAFKEDFFKTNTLNKFMFFVEFSNKLAAFILQNLMKIHLLSIIMMNFYE